MLPSEGDVVAVERTFDPATVRAFAAVTGDGRDRHPAPDEDGRLEVHRLLVASMMTEVGGRYGILSRTMASRFREPVYTGETVRCEVEFTTVERHERGVDVAADVTWRRGGEVVLTGGFDGLIRE